MKKITWLLLLLTCAPVWAQRDRIIPVRFAPGTTGTHINEGVARGETATFVLEAAAGQKMRVVVNSVENNAVFDIVSPGGMEMGRSHLKDGDQVWFGKLPHTGPYKIIVGSERGGASFTILMDVW